MRPDTAEPAMTCGNAGPSHRVDRVPPAAIGNSVHVPLRDTTSPMSTADGEVAPMSRCPARHTRRQ
jgi:hypothetical protein